MALSANEQWLLELINRGRLDPLGEAARYDIPLNEGLDSGTIDATPKQPLAPNAELADAAEAHSAWMLETDVFSHAGVGGSSPKDRMVSAGYDFGGAYSWGENLSWRGSTAGIDLEAAIPAHHAGLYASAGHRENLMQESFREVGIAQLEGNFTHAGTTYRSSMLTEDFAHARGRLFVTGVAYDDRDGDAFYDPGEGRRGVAFRAGDAQAESARAGGYALPVSGPAATVAIDGGGVSGEVRVDTSAGNVKLDLVDGALATSADLTLRAGPTEAVALGAGDVRLTGRGSGDRLTGNGGDNRLAGRGGGDRLEGRGGDDTLEGDSGGDVLDGGGGDDRLKGGSGDDILDGGGGTDTVKLDTARADTTVLERGAEFVFLSVDGLDRATNIERIAFSDTTTAAKTTLRAGLAEAEVLDSGDVRLTGKAGDNLLGGHGGDDVLKGRGGDDRLDGGGGDDRLKGGGGDDILDGGGGTDTVKLNTARADTTVLERGDEFVFLSGDGLDRATNIERIAFSDTTRDAAATHRPGIANFGTEDGWHAQDAYPRRLGDIDGDGKDDIVGFGAAATFSARADGDGTFSGFGEALANFGQAQAWNGFEDNPRLLGDIDGDGADDIVGFGDGITLSALAKGDGTFRPAEKAIANFSQGQFWDSFEANPRALGDINGDGAEDLLGFGDSLTLAALSNGDGTFQPAEKVLTNFSQGQYWNSYGANPRLLGDINRDGRDDIVGFGDDRTFAALARSDGTFGAVRPAIADFSQAQAWSSFDATPRLMADLDGDKADDIVGFGNADIVVALAEGDGTFGPVRKADADLSRAHGWSSQDALPRLAGDVDEDGADELVGFSPFGPLVADYTGDGFEFLG